MTGVSDLDAGVFALVDSLDKDLTWLCQVNAFINSILFHVFDATSNNDLTGVPQKLSTCVAQVENGVSDLDAGVFALVDVLDRDSTWLR